MPRGGRKRTTWTKKTRPKGGRKKGSKDKIPRSFKGSIKKIFEEVATEQPDLLYKAVVNGLRAPAPKSFPYLQLVTAYIDGKPMEVFSAADVRQFVRQTGALFVAVVIDPDLRRQFAAGMRQLVQLGDGDVIDVDARQT
jgi:hypothetical protein